MIAFSISKFIRFLNEIYMNDLDKNSISARELYLKYLNCDDATSKALCNNPLVFKCLLEILSKRNIISFSSDNNRININKLNYIDYSMHFGEYDNDVIEMENYDYNADYIDGSCIIDDDQYYKYDYENNICYINGDICDSNDSKKDVYSYFYRKYVFIDENDLNAINLNLTYQNEFNKYFFKTFSNERPKFLVSFEYCFVKIKEQIGKKIGYINRDFTYYYDKYSYYIFKKHLKQFKYDDLIRFLRGVSADLVIEGDNNNEDIYIKNLMPTIWEMAQFLHYIDSSNLNNIVNAYELIKCFKKYTENIHDFVEYPDDEVPYGFYLYEDEIELEEYIEENIDEYFYSNFTYENIDYYLDFEKINEPEKLERLEYDSKEIMKRKALRKEAIKRFCEKPFGKEYSDLSEDELLKYEKVIKKLKKYLR